MKKFLSVTVTAFAYALSFSTLAFAQSHEEQVNLDLEAAALSHIAVNADAHQEFDFLAADNSNPFAFLSKLKEQVDAVKATLLASFDTDGNGKIDPGPETEGFKSGIQAVVMVLADSNANGKIDAEDISVLVKQLLDKVQAQLLSKVCPSVKEQALASGDFLQFRPLLSQFYSLCLTHDSAAE